MSYYTTDREPDILCNVIVSEYVTFYRINRFFLNTRYYLSLLTKCLCGRMNGPADRSLETPILVYQRRCSGLILNGLWSIFQMKHFHNVAGANLFENIHFPIDSHVLNYKTQEC